MVRPVCVYSHLGVKNPLNLISKISPLGDDRKVFEILLEGWTTVHFADSSYICSPYIALFHFCRPDRATSTQTTS